MPFRNNRTARPQITQHRCAAGGDAEHARTSPDARCAPEHTARLARFALLLALAATAGCEKPASSDTPPHWSERMQDIPQAHLSVRVAELDRRIAADPDQPELRIARGLHTAQLAMYEEPLRQIHLLAMALHDFRTAHEQSGGWWPIVYELYDPAEEETIVRGEAEKPRRREERGGQPAALACAAHLLYSIGAVHDAITLLNEAEKSQEYSAWTRTIDTYVRAAVQTQNWDSAARELATITENCSGPHCWLAYQLIGLIHLSHGRYEQAADSLGKTFALDPYDMTTLMQYSMALNRLGRKEEAETVLKKLVAKDRLALSRAFDNAASLLAEGRHDEALVIARTMLLQYPEGDEVRELIGRIHLRKGEYRDALRAFEAIRPAHPAHRAARYGIAEAYQGLRRYRAALEMLDELLAQDAAPLEIHRSRALCLAQLDEPQAAEAAFRQALATAPDPAGIQFDYGAFLMDQGRIDDAKEQFLAAARGDARNATIQYQLGLIERRRDDPQAAAVYFRKSWALNPSPAALYPLIETLLECGEVAEAQQRVEEILSREPRNADALELRACVHLAGGNLKNANADIAEAKHVQPLVHRRLMHALLSRAQNDAPREWSAVLHTLARRNHDFDWPAVHLFLATDELDDPRDAVRAIQRLLARRNASGQAVNAARYLNGDIDADDLLRSAVTRPERTEAYFVIAEAHRMAGRMKAARENYRNAVAAGAPYLPIHHLAQRRLKELEPAGE